jgi:hypothetical protein
MIPEIETQRISTHKKKKKKKAVEDILTLLRQKRKAPRKLSLFSYPIFDERNSNLLPPAIQTR